MLSFNESYGSSEKKVDKPTILVRALDHYARTWKIKKAIESCMNGFRGPSWGRWDRRDLRENLRGLKYEEEK